jgi:FkbM family methyltransferase
VNRLREAARDRLRALGYVWFRKPDLPWGLDLETDLKRSFDLSRAGCVIDVGAHLGWETVRFAQMFPVAQVHAFELVPATCEQLRRNVADRPRIHVHGYGLSNARGSARIALQADAQLNSMSGRAQPAGTGEVVEVHFRRLDEVADKLGLHAVDLLKIDAEGHDLQVLEGGTALFAARRVRAVLVEVDFGGSVLQHGNFAHIAAWLEPYGLRFVALHESHVVNVDGVPHLDYANALFLREAA